jgi:hypothetical protein
MLAKALAMSLDQANDDSKDIFYCKKIKYVDGQMYPIILQNDNGPCPLLAICNALLLKGAIKVDLSTAYVSADELVSLINNYILERLDKTKGLGLYSEVMKANFERNANDAIDMLGKLKRGLDVNLKFSGVLDFEFTAELVIFDSVDLTLLHGWLPDPSVSSDGKALPVMKKLGLLSYNQLVDWIVTVQDTPSLPLDNLDIDDAVKKKKEAAIREQEKDILLEFLTTHGGVQVTKYGLDEIRNTLAQQHPHNLSADRSGGIVLGEGPHVMFSNNHFYTLLYKEGNLYVLLTDMGFLYEAVVWERLDKIGGDNVFCFSDLTVLVHKSDNPMSDDLDSSKAKAAPIAIRTSGSLPIIAPKASLSPSPSPRRFGTFGVSPYSKFGVISPVSPQNLSVLRNRSYSRSPPNFYTHNNMIASPSSQYSYSTRNYNHIPPQTPPASLCQNSPSPYTTPSKSPSPLRNNYYGVSPKTELRTSYEVLSVLKNYLFSRYLTPPGEVCIDSLLQDFCKSEYELRDLWAYMERRMQVDVPVLRQLEVRTVGDFIGLILSLDQ